VYFFFNLFVCLLSKVDRKRFQSRCEVQREVLHSVVNKVIYSLLMDQQRTLVAAGFPHFSSGTVERIQTVMAALRSGEQPETKFDGPLLEELSIQKKLVCALLSLRVNLAPPPDPRSGRTGSRERATGSENGKRYRAIHSVAIVLVYFDLLGPYILDRLSTFSE
jgi:hypothetical protein